MSQYPYPSPCYVRGYVDSLAQKSLIHKKAPLQVSSNRTEWFHAMHSARTCLTPAETSRSFGVNLMHVDILLNPLPYRDVPVHIEQNFSDYHKCQRINQSSYHRND